MFSSSEQESTVCPETKKECFTQKTVIMEFDSYITSFFSQNKDWILSPVNYIVSSVGANPLDLNVNKGNDNRQ